MRLDYKIRRDGPLATAWPCDVIGQIAEALRYVQTRGIGHGDIKSENILLVAERSAAGWPSCSLRLARTDATGDRQHIEGTPEYLAPSASPARPPRRAATLRPGHPVLGVPGRAAALHRQRHQCCRRPSWRAAAPPRVTSTRALDERADSDRHLGTAKHPEDRHPDVSSFLYELRTLSTMLASSRAGARRPGPRARRPSPGESRPRACCEHAPVALASVDAYGRVRAATAPSSLHRTPGRSGRPVSRRGRRSSTSPGPARRSEAGRGRSHHGQAGAAAARRRRAATVDTAVILTPAPGERGAAAGNVHLALHPLATRY